MAMMSAHPAPAPSRAVQGILCIEAAMLLFVAQDAVMKGMLTSYPVWPLLFARSVMAVVVLVPLIAWLGGPHSLRSALWPLHMARAFLFAVGFAMFYAAFPFMGLAEVSTIFFSAPLLTALMAALFLGERIGAHRAAALVVGFAGVVIAMNPMGGQFSMVAVLPLLCALTYAASQIIARRIGERESTLTVGLYTLCFSGVMIVPIGWGVAHLVPLTPETAHLRWSLPEGVIADLPRLAGLGAIGMVAYMLASRAYQVAAASLVAPFDYTYLPFAAVLGYLVWAEVPSQATLTGMALIIGAGLYIGWRELRAARRGDAIPITAEATFAPGSPLPPLMPEEERAP
ncbi:MAG: EamA/RhaT family transporter [Alphaproteobacteria bacterium HGW-Alphaproteobacteria-1]|jgi:drug/metabolite transporter (DMT)-like permease|nr:MAG: EamA/RhaT family transporter [Alphaproteobacteria bacterium HGW-Alphaproteobacteria-1]